MTPRRRVLNGRYELDELPIGKGGMGEVWLGRDTKLDRRVAVKLIRFPDDLPDDELVARFVRESRITASLEHPGVPAVYDVGTDQGRPFMVMQRIVGISGADLIAEHGPLPIAWAAAIAAQACAVLAAAHRASLVHRDLKPANLMLCPDGTVRVLDFGLAVALAAADSQITRTGQTLGTPAYMAPELVLAGTTGPATDLYAVGATLHELIAGRQPFRATTAYAVMNKHVDERPPPLRGIRADVPAELEALVLHLLAKATADRPASAEDVYHRLVPFVQELTTLPGVLTPPSIPSPVRMYASVVGRMPADAPVPRAPMGVAGSAGFSRGELRRAREEARSLVRASRYEQAAEALATVAQQASMLLPGADPDLLSLRFELANVLFDGGDYARGGREFGALATDLAERDGPADGVVLQCRQQEATCTAMLGHVDEALAQLRALLADELRWLGIDDERVLNLRKHIGLLELGSDRPGRARATLGALLTDLERVHGPRNVATVEVRALIEGLPASGAG
ncbi:MAG: serine/threonine protein kinase [Pseudonocardia sp.]|nr:serine/threonine protein kinase [Pseudonocardia sp.]